MASREMYFQHLHAVNSTGMSQVLVRKSACVLTKDGVTSAISARRISNDAKDDNSMKTVRIHIVNLPYFVSVGEGGWKYTRSLSQFIAVRSNPSHPASSLDSKPILPVAIVCDDIRNRTPN